MVQVAVMAAMSAKRKGSGSPNGHSSKKAKKVCCSCTSHSCRVLHVRLGMGAQAKVAL